MKLLHYYILILSVVCCFSCTRSGQEIVIPDNYAEPYDGVPTIKVEAYINRVYIDLLGREPLNDEMDRDVTALRNGELQKEAREALVDKLMFDESFVAGDSSYKIAYYHRLYDLNKARLLEGVSNQEIGNELAMVLDDIRRDSLAEDWAGVQEGWEKFNRLNAVITSEAQYREGEINIQEVYSRMVNNLVYDIINMNSINFIRACFDNLFFRLPTQAEFDTSFPIIEYNTASTLFGKSAGNKTEYIDILVNSGEYHEGMIRWAYKNLLAREPSAEEITDLIDPFFEDKDFQKIQKAILVTDEYANF